MMREGNVLFPVFLRLDKLQVLIVGAGEVGWEKLSMMYRHSGNAHITIVAPEVKSEIQELVSSHTDEIRIIKKKFSEDDLKGKDIVIIATADHDLNVAVWEKAKQMKVLTNVADTPELCDFYLSSVVKKGDLKIAISSNGKSPTLTKRIRELLEDVLPEEVDDLLARLSEIRKELKGDFESKVKKLDEITAVFKNKE